MAPVTGPDRRPIVLVVDDNDKVRAALVEILGDLDADAVETGTYLASFHRVENTYLSTFQALGGTPGTNVVYMRGVASGGDGNHSGSLPSVGVNVMVRVPAPGTLKSVALY